MLLSLMAIHSPAYLHCYVLDLGGRNFNVFKDFPHVGAIINPDEEGYEERVEQLLRELNDAVTARKDLFNRSGITDFYQYNQNASKEQLPAIVVVIDNFVEFTETFGNPNDNVESVLDKFILLARQAKSYGVHFVATASRLNAMPNQIYSLFTERYTLKLTDPTEYRAITGGHVADIGDIPG
jgi:DNA segregation ATPase FtsK/SpoIIIE-like protein